MANYKCIIPRHNDTIFQQICEPSLKKLGTQVLQVYDKDKTVSESIFKKYNAGIEAVLQGGVDDKDIVIFLHEDVFIMDNLFKEKIELLFSEKPEIGLVGVAGTTELTERGGWWMNDPSKLRGHLIQGKDNGGVNNGFHLVKGGIGYFDNLVAIDGCIMITTGKVVKDGLIFDDATYIGNDFYDVDIALTVLEKGYKIAVADALIFHQSTGQGVFKPTWDDSKKAFLSKWQNKGYTIPITTDQFKPKLVEDSEIVEITL